MRVVVTILTTIAILIATSAIEGRQNDAQADPYRWCAAYGAGFGSESCYFTTIEQCRASVSGLGGFCRPNNLYDGKPVATEDGQARRRS
jgi:hypothetical protein